MKGWVNIIESCNNPGFPYWTSSFSRMRGDGILHSSSIHPFNVMRILDILSSVKFFAHA